mgnify:CR=1 FL=1
MGNSVDKMMDNWGSEVDHDRLFSDQIEENSAFSFEEPDIGLDELILDEPQSGITSVPADIKKVDIIDHELKSEGQPGIFNMEADELKGLDTQKKQNDSDAELSKLFSYIADHGLIHGMGLYYADNLETIEGNYGEEEGI